MKEKSRDESHTETKRKKNWKNKKKANQNNYYCPLSETKQIAWKIANS